VIRLFKFIFYEFWGELYFFVDGEGRLLYRWGGIHLPIFRSAYLVTSSEKRDQIKAVQRKIWLVTNLVWIPFVLGVCFHFGPALLYFIVRYFPVSLLVFIPCALGIIIFAFWSLDRIMRLTTTFPVVRAPRMVIVFWLYNAVSIHKFREFAEPFDIRILGTGMFLGWSWVALSFWLISGEYHVVLPAVQLYYAVTASTLVSLMTFAKR
jgi:hypothetical protein